MRREAIYLVEKASGLTDENGVDLYYTVAARLTRTSADEDFENDIQQGKLRVRKIYATK